ncbi:hypothetical protein M2373_000456 [Chryseobacterium sp. JUb7]|nr:hypothetical protein [Chryseobacterium sp. JUb7]
MLKSQINEQKKQFTIYLLYFYPKIMYYINLDTRSFKYTILKETL